MKHINITMGVLAAALTTNIAFAQQSFTGKIIDQKTQQPLSGASIYFPDLKIGSVSKNDGTFKIPNLPKRNLLVQISLVGYKPITITQNFNSSSTETFEMETSVAEINEIVVTGFSGASERNRTPTPIKLINNLTLRQTASTNIIDAIANQPGIAQITTGAGISKPVIRGLGYNRVIVVNDGIRQEGQQWGDEHGIEIDENSVDRVEILKGPASLTYGSDAMAGVINFLAPNIPEEGEIKGNISSNYQSNNGLISESANLAGNIKGFNWDFRYSNKIAHDYKNKMDGPVFNSRFRENNIGGTIGINKSWGYSHLTWSSYQLKPGIVEGERDAVTGQFTKGIIDENGDEQSIIAPSKDFKSYTPYLPYQQINHHKIVWDNNIYLKSGSLKTTLGWQLNQRKEFEEVDAPKDYGLFFNMNTLNYDVKYILPQINNYNVTFGVNGMYQNSENKGSEFLIPAYHLFDFGLYGVAKKNIGKWDLQAGLRIDTRNVQTQSLWLNEDEEVVTDPGANDTQKFAAAKSNFSGLSASAGATYQISDKWYTKLNFSRGYRAPNIAELSSNGVHEGTVQYIHGDPNLKPEHSFQTDYTLGFNSLHVTAEANLFYNQIGNYIFLQKMVNADGSELLTEGYQTFHYTSGDAHLYGGEVMIDIHPHPLDWLHFENSFSMVKSIQQNQPDSTRYLPFTPAPKFSSELRANSKKIGKIFSNAYAKVGIDKYFDQNDVYSAYDTETPTPGYLLLKAGLGFDVTNSKRTLFSVYLNANNLTNVSYQNHLSRLKYLDENVANGRQGVFNMGRNYSVKVIIPIPVKSANN